MKRVQSVRGSLNLSPHLFFPSVIMLTKISKHECEYECQIVSVIEHKHKCEIDRVSLSESATICMAIKECN